MTAAPRPVERKSILDKQEISRAQVGPRDRKDPRSREYAIQTIYSLKRYLESRNLDEQRVESELEKIEKWHHWEVLGYPSKDALLEAETGLSEKDIIDKMAKLKEGTKNAPEFMTKRQAGQLGGKGSKAVDNIKCLGGTSQSYLARRLRRDHPEIFSKLETYPSVRAAALEAGIVKPRAQVEITPKSFAKYIANHFTRAQIDELILTLTELRNGSNSHC
jgi:hypothetical protein